MTIDIFFTNKLELSHTIKFGGILLCLLYILVTAKDRENKKDTCILGAAMVFTLIADWCILLHDYYVLGLVAFIAVQYLYFVRIHNGMGPYKFLLARNLIISTILIFTVIKLNINDCVLSLAIVYFVTFFFNIVDLLKKSIELKDKKRYFFLLGLVLFIICDINVGIYNALDFVSIDYEGFNSLYEIASIAMWFFYLPAQVILSLSELNYKIHKNQ